MCVHTRDRGKKVVSSNGTVSLASKACSKTRARRRLQKKTRGIADELSKKSNQDIAKEVKQVASKTAEGKRYSGPGEEAQGTDS